MRYAFGGGRCADSCGSDGQMRRLLLLLLAIGWLGLDTALAQPGTTASVAGRLRRLVCRGKAGIDLRVHRDTSPSDPGGKYVMMVLTYTPSANEGPDFSGLQPGECGWNPFNFPDEPPEPGRVYFNLLREAQPWSALETRAMDTTVKAGAFFPDPISLPRYLGDPTRYYSFYVDDVNYFSGSFGAYREPQAEPTLVTISGPIGPAVTADSRLELRCRGGPGLGFTPGGSAGTNLVNMALVYRVSAAVPGDAGRGLDPGSCAWVDRAGKPREPGRVEFTTAGNAQLHQIQSGSPVDRSATAAERYPDANTIPPYMTDPAHYWSFSVTLGSPATARAHAAWKPAIIDIVTSSGPAGQSTDRAGTRDVASTGLRNSSPTLDAASVPLTFREVVRNINEYRIRFGARVRANAVVEYARTPPVRINGRLTLQSPVRLWVAQQQVSGFAAEYATSPARNLAKGTRYYFVIRVPASGRLPAQDYSGEFSTPGTQTVIVSFSRIHILNDSDKDSAGEIFFQFNLAPMGRYRPACYPTDKCVETLGPFEWESGSDNPVSVKLQMDSLPDIIWVWVQGHEDDVVNGTSRPSSETNWMTGARSYSAFDINNAKSEYDISKLADNARLGFKLRSIDGGVLMYEVHGEIQVIRR